MHMSTTAFRTCHNEESDSGSRATFLGERHAPPHLLVVGRQLEDLHGEPVIVETTVVAVQAPIQTIHISLATPVGRRLSPPRWSTRKEHARSDESLTQWGENRLVGLGAWNGTDLDQHACGLLCTIPSVRAVDPLGLGPQDEFASFENQVIPL